MPTDRQGDRPLHPIAGLRPGGWYACQLPDRAPVAEVTAFDSACPACTEVLDKVRRLSPGRHLTMETRTRRGVEVAGTESVDARLARAKARKN